MARQPALLAWGQEVTAHINTELQTVLGPEKPIEHFLKIWPVQPRVKGVNSFVRKALYRGKNYSNPLTMITDQVGARFVTLLADDLRQIEAVVIRSTFWTATKSRDFEEEREADPLSFVYQSLHYVVAAAATHDFHGVQIAGGTACEIQIRTLLQHAYSELSHDAFYKPTMPGVADNALLRRKVARSMALIETTDLIFKDVMAAINESMEELRRPVREAATVYQREIGTLEPIDFQLSDFVLAPYRQFLPQITTDTLSAFLADNEHMREFIRRSAATSAFFAQPVSLIVSMLIEQEDGAISEGWPLEPDMLSPIYSQLGMAEP